MKFGKNFPYKREIGSLVKLFLMLKVLLSKTNGTQNDSLSARIRQSYAHLSPTHLQDTVEGLSMFGQAREFGTDTKIVNGAVREEPAVV